MPTSPRTGDGRLTHRCLDGNVTVVDVRVPVIRGRDMLCNVVIRSSDGLHPQSYDRLDFGETARFLARYLLRNRSRVAAQI